VLALGSGLVWAFKGFSLTSKGVEARSGRLNHPKRPYSEMLEAAQRKLVEAQFFHRRLVSERDGRLALQQFHIKGAICKPLRRGPISRPYSHREPVLIGVPLELLAEPDLMDKPSLQDTPSLS
jgi:hypothetical protein